jgi:hypothetical protein
MAIAVESGEVNIAVYLREKNPLGGFLGMQK